MSAWCWKVSRAIDKKGIWGHLALARRYLMSSKIQCLGRQEQSCRIFSIQKKKGEGFIPVLGGILKLAWLRHAQCCCQQLANRLLLTFPVWRTRSELELAFSMSVEQALSLRLICFVITPFVFSTYLENKLFHTSAHVNCSVVLLIQASDDWHQLMICSSVWNSEI